MSRKASRPVELEEALRAEALLLDRRSDKFFAVRRASYVLPGE